MPNNISNLDQAFEQWVRTHCRPNRSRAGGDPCGILGDPCGILGHPCGILGDPLGMDLGLPMRAGRPPPHMVQLDEVVAGPIFQMRCKVAFTVAMI